MIRTTAGRTAVAFVAAFTVSALGVLLVVQTGSLAVGWILVPGGMLALDHMKMNEVARLWFWGAAVANVALWTFIIYVALDVLNGRRRRHDEPSPNPRLQRTRSAPLRSPLSRKPFGERGETDRP